MSEAYEGQDKNKEIEALYEAVVQHVRDEMRPFLRNIYEVWAGSDGIPIPETAPEAYLLRLLENMKDEAKAGLHRLDNF